jgi:hypothetical protein
LILWILKIYIYILRVDTKKPFRGGILNYTVKSVLIICAVAVASFFTASLVIPEKNAVAPAKRVAQPKGFVPVALAGGESIPVVVAGSAPAENPITAPEAGIVPLDLKAAGAKPAPPAARVALFNPKAAPPNTAAARIDPKAGPVIEAKAVPAPPPPAPAASFTAAAAAQTPPDTVKKRKTDPSALGYKLKKTAVCAAVENKEPAGVADKFSKDAGAVYYYTHIVGAADTTSAVLHRWYREGKLIQTSILQIRSPNWRTHSKRNLATVEEPAGNWRVEVIDRGTGKVLETASFVVE